MLELYAAPTVNAQRAILGLVESGLPHRLHRVDLKHKSADFLAANRYGRVPTLVDRAAADGKQLVLDQSGAILLYLGERCDHLVPQDARARAECHRWLLMHANDLGPAFVNSYNMTRLGEPQDRAAQAFRDGTARFCGMLDDRLAESRFLAGPGLSIADCAVYPDIPWALQDFAPVSGLRHLRRWADEMAARPAVRQAMAWGQA